MFHVRWSISSRVMDYFLKHDTFIANGLAKVEYFFQHDWVTGNVGTQLDYLFQGVGLFPPT
jgi:hypothetical protein